MHTTGTDSVVEFEIRDAIRGSSAELLIILDVLQAMRGTLTLAMLKQITRERWGAIRGLVFIADLDAAGLLRINNGLVGLSTLGDQIRQWLPLQIVIGVGS